jgi:hypothetical protein
MAVIGTGMYEYPEVEVVEVNIDPVLHRVVGTDGVPIRVDLGDEKVSGNLNRILQAMSRRPSKLFLLKWRGGKVPHDAVVDGYTVDYTKNGVVDGRGEGIIGMYDRLVECGGADGQDQLLLVRIFQKDRRE